MADEDNRPQGESEFNLEATLAAAKKAGVNLLTERQLTERLARESRKHEELRATIDAEKARAAEIERKLGEYESKGKSSEQLLAEREQAMARQNAALQAEIKKRDELLAQTRAERLNRELDVQLLGALGRARNPARAAILARAEIPGLTIDPETMRLMVIDPATKIQGDAATAIKEWLDSSPDLLAAAPGGPPTRGAAPKGAPEAKDPLEGLAPGAAQLSVAFRGARRRG